MTAMLWKYFSITEKWKTPTILYLSLQQKLFSLCWSYPILRPKFWTSWDYSSIHTSFHSVFLQSDVTIKRHHAPLAHALGYTEKEHKKRAAARITVHLLIPNFWERKSNILTWGLCIFVGWKIISHFHQCYQNTLIHRPKADELRLWDSASWRSSSSQVSTTHPCLCSQIHPLKSTYMLFACSKSEWHQSSRHLCSQLCDTKTVGQALLPLFLAATKEALPAAHHPPSWLTCKHSRRCLAVPP